MKKIKLKKLSKNEKKVLKNAYLSEKNEKLLKKMTFNIIYG
jgi:hypothetical protein